MINLSTQSPSFSLVTWLHLDEAALKTLLKSCETIKHLKKIHSHSIKLGLLTNPNIVNKILALYCSLESDDMTEARQLFDAIPEPNVFTWNVMIKGYSRINEPRKGIQLYLDMLTSGVKPDQYTHPFLLKRITSDLALTYGKALHGHIVKYGFESNESVQNALIHLYGLCRQIDLAHRVFNMSSKRDVVSWNELITGYNRTKQFDEVKKLYSEMESNRVSPTSVTLISLLSACAKSRDLKVGQHVHNYVLCSQIELNLKLENSLIGMYAACGEMDAAIEIFGSMKNRDIISWTTIVAGYANLGEVDAARNYFNQMAERDQVSWTAMIDGYLQVNRFREVLALFREMQGSNVQPDEYTVVSALTACANLGALELGEWVRAYIDRKKINNDIFVGNALIDMYFKCGNVEEARKIFNEMPQKDKFTWTAVVVGLAINGHGQAALDMFAEMLNAAIKPDEITYIGVLSACIHKGMVDMGRKFFAVMTSEHGIEPNVAHYGCLVDLLGRAGHIEDAYEVVCNMPIKPNATVWGSLLNACRVHKHPEIAEMAAGKILQVEPENDAVYVVLCSVYASCNRWEDVAQVRKAMMKKRIKKTPGCSLIEIDGIIHEFVAGDQTHPETRAIYMKLEEMIGDLRFSGYSPDTSEVFLNDGEEDMGHFFNTDSSCWH